MLSRWVPTRDQVHIAKWAAFSVGYAAPHIGHDDLQQVALIGIWKARVSGNETADTTVARNACLSYLQRSLGHTGSARRRGNRATAAVETSAETITMSGVSWETPETILEAKQSLAGFCGMRDLHAAVLADFIDGDLSRLEIAARHGVTVVTVNKISDTARRVIAHGVPFDNRRRPRITSRTRGTD